MNRLDDEGVGGRVRGGARAGGHAGAELATSAGGERVGQQPALVAQRGADLVQCGHQSSANAAAAASTVRSMCSLVWASDGNHASNCDGGG